MGDLVKGVLGGGWSLLVGWFLPSSLNLLLFWFVLAPQLGALPPVRWLRDAQATQVGVALTLSAAVLGLILAALQTPLYRLLEGYVGWRPQTRRGRLRWLYTPYGSFLDWSWRRQVTRKQILAGRIDLVELSALEKADALRPQLRERLAEVRADARLRRYEERDRARTASQLALLWERLRRYPVDDDQVVPTRFGNAIRRLEEYGYDRFRLDSQSLWYELNAVATEQARRQVDQARTTIDFLVCLLYGNVLIAVGAIVTAILDADKRIVLLGIGAALLTLAYGWYRMAVSSTDDWAAATRALVNVGRQPLADGLGLQLPETLKEERAMWSTVSRLAARPFDEKAAEGDRFRERPDGGRERGSVGRPGQP